MTRKNRALVKSGAITQIRNEIRPFERMFEEMHSFDPFKDFEKSFGFRGLRIPEISFSTVPEIDIRDEGERVVVNAEIPGFSHDEIKTTLHNNILTISGRTKHEKKSRNSYESEIREFERSVTLPGHLKISMLVKRYKNCILTVEVPKGTERRLIAA